MHLTARRAHKSIGPTDVAGVDLPQFTVLTGPNGSGKSNLLEAISENIFTFAELGHLSEQQVRTFRLNELVRKAIGDKPDFVPRPVVDVLDTFA